MYDFGVLILSFLSCMKTYCRKAYPQIYVQRRDEVASSAHALLNSMPARMEDNYSG